MGHGRSSNSEKIEDYTIENGVDLTIKLIDFLKKSFDVIRNPLFFIDFLKKSFDFL